MTICFSGIGKTKSIKVLKNDKKFIKVVSLLGENDIISESVKDILEENVCLFYGDKNETNVHKARYHLFTNRLRFPEPPKFSTTRDTLYQYFNRVNYQYFNRVKYSSMEVCFHITEPI